MNRHKLSGRSILLVFGMLSICLTGCDGSNYPEDIPLMNGEYPEDQLNILVILTDDQRADSLFAMPTIEKLAAQGVVFTKAFVTTPVCTPVRASILSGGLYSQNTGVLNNRLGGRFDDTDTIATELQKKGYKTGFIGKYLHGYNVGYIPPGWTYFAANNNGGMINDWFNLKDITIGSSGLTSARGKTIGELKQYITYFQRDQALEFLDKYHKSPFFLLLSTYAPHAPRIYAPEDSDRFSDYVYQAPEETDMSDKPEWAKKAASYKKFPWLPSDSNYMVFEMQNQLRTLAAVDRSVNAILHKLADLDVLSQTVIIFTSDNGLLWGEHGLVDKGLPYEPAIHVPLIISLPGGKPAINNNLVAMNLDISATIFDIAGISKKTDGMSLLQILQGKKHIPWRNEILIEADGYLKWWEQYGFMADGLGHWVGLRTKEWKYIEHPTGEKELYNLLADPDEFENLASNPEYTSIMEKLANRHRELTDTNQ